MLKVEVVEFGEDQTCGRHAPPFRLKPENTSCFSECTQRLKTSPDLDLSFKIAHHTKYSKPVRDQDLLRSHPPGAAPIDLHQRACVKLGREVAIIEYFE
jgi:hypothetical protein